LRVPIPLPLVIRRGQTLSATVGIAVAFSTNRPRVLCHRRLEAPRFARRGSVAFGFADSPGVSVRPSVAQRLLAGGESSEVLSTLRFINGAKHFRDGWCIQGGSTVLRCRRSLNDRLRTEAAVGGQSLRCTQTEN